MCRRTLTTLSLAVLVLTAALLRADDAPKGGKELNGDWEVVSITREGKEAPPQAKTVWTFMDQTLVLAVVGNVVVQKASIRVHASNMPKTLDVIQADGPDKGKAAHGIYEIKNDELHICNGGTPGDARPSEFSAKEGSGNVLTTLKRVKK
jgi:uncharacterized protein (TIGR03067 family)